MSKIIYIFINNKTYHFIVNKKRPCIFVLNAKDNNTMKRFEEQIVLITGGAQGIGMAIAERISTEGGRVIIADIDEKMLTETQKHFKDRDIKVVLVL